MTSSPFSDPEAPLVLPFPGATGRGVRVAVIDSGVNPRHPHIGRVAGGVSIGPEGIDEDSYPDLLGHGTAVLAAIQEKAPEAEYFAVRVFHDALRTSAAQLIRAIDWAIEQRMDVVNLSLGTVNPAHTERFAEAVNRATRSGMLPVAAREAGGCPCLPGSLPDVLGTNLSWDCDRNRYRCERTSSGMIFSASGYPRPVPGVPQIRNLNGISFAVANMTGFAVRAYEAAGPGRTPGQVAALLASGAEVT